MKLFLVLLLLCIAESQCQLVKNLLPKRNQDTPSVLSNAKQTLANGTVAVLDAVGNVAQRIGGNKNDADVPSGVPTVVDKVCVIEDDPTKCM